MFIYSQDSLIRKNQEDEAIRSLKLIKKYVKIKHSPELEKSFEENCDSPNYLVDFVNCCNVNNRKLIITIIGRDDNYFSSLIFNDGFSLLNKRLYDYIPYIKMSFVKPELVNGIKIDHSYLLFFNKNDLYEDSLSETINMFNRFNKIKIFI